MSLAAKRGHVTVRMYNVGFGDAFLLVFPDPEKRVLIDCGMHLAGPGPRKMEDVVTSILEDISDGGDARIDVVVCTHRHHDHISGFADPRWKDVEVGEVWMPWTEDPRDPAARRIRERQAHLAAALSAALAGVEGNSPAAILAANSSTNDKAMRMLHSGFGGDPPRRFLPADESVVSDLPCKALKSARVRVRVLGPSRDEKVIRDMDPPSGAAYLRFTGEDGAADEFQPFANDWMLSSQAVALDDDLKHLLLSGKERSTIRRAAEGDLFGAAVALEKAINGTSLVLCFDCGGARLLFPADAQWGTWKRMLDDGEATALIERVNLLKVGHHGSHNATPKAFVELLAKRPKDLDLWAMVPTRPITMWPKIPKSELLRALADTTQRLARSDEGTKPSAPGFHRWDEQAIDAQIPI